MSRDVSAQRPPGLYDQAACHPGGAPRRRGIPRAAARWPPHRRRNRPHPWREPVDASPVGERRTRLAPARSNGALPALQPGVARSPQADQIPPRCAAVEPAWHSPGAREGREGEERERAKPTDLGRKLRRLRMRCNLGVVEAAKRAKVSAGFLSAIELSKANPSVSTLQRLGAPPTAPRSSTSTICRSSRAVSSAPRSGARFRRNRACASSSCRSARASSKATSSASSRAPGSDGS